MSILNVNKINPVGGGSTVTIAGIASVTNNISVGNSVTAASFVGPIEGNVTGNADTASGLSGNPSINTTGIVTATSFVPTEGQLSHRNKLINGAMTISQRGTSETGVNSSGYKNAPDRWTQQISSIDSAFTVSQSTDSPDGFANSYKIDITTADTSLGAGHVHFFRQKIEGQNLQDFAFGTSSAKQLTVSFYVKTNKTGTYICELFNIGGNKQVSKSYTVSNTNWNRYTLTFPADTTTAITNDNANRFHVAFWLSSGSNYTSGTLNSSAFATNVQANRAVGQVNLHDSTSNEWYLTGVQLEVGPVATPFEHCSIGEQLQRCRRYYQVLVDQAGTNSQKSFAIACAYSSSSMHSTHLLSPEMRTVPTLDYTTGSNYYTAYGNGTSDPYDAMTIVGNSHANAVDIMTSSGLSVTQGNAVLCRTSNAASKIAFTAEL